MAKKSDNNKDAKYPEVGFRFKVSIEGSSSDQDASFTEVGGLSAVISTEEITEGGENRFKHRLPSVATYPPLTLKRGVIDASSDLLDWITNTLEAGLSKAIETKKITVNLQSEEDTPLKTWTFEAAYPIKYEISGLKSNSNQLAVEAMEFSYRYMSEG